MRTLLKALAPAALLAGLVVSGAEAAPAGSALTPLKTLPEASSAVEKTYWVVRCHYRHHRKYCHRVWVGHRHHRRYH
ncbi:MAG: hypothetical protein AB7O57_16575 [Hyphomicrobiaceae bacterium]